MADFETERLRHRAILASAVDFAIIATDRNGRVTDWNVGAAQIFGWSAAEMQGAPVERIFTPEDRAEGCPKVEMQRALEGGCSSDERWHLRENGTRFWGSGELMPLRGDDGAHLGFLKILRDGTQEKHANERKVLLLVLAGLIRDLDDPLLIMEAAAAALGQALGAHRVGFFDMLDDHTLAFTAGWVDGTLPLLHGIWPAASIGSAYVAAVKRGAVPGIADTREDPLTEDSLFHTIGTRASIGYPVMREGRWVAGLYVHHAEPRAWSAQEVAFVGAIAEQAWDVVQRAVARAQLRAGEARWHAVFEAMHEGFALCQVTYHPDGRAADFRYLEVNRAWERLTGVPPARTVELLGSEVFPGLDPFWLDTYARVVATGEPAQFEYQIESIGQWFEVFAFRTEPGRFAALFLNITERKASEERQSLLALEVDHRAKNALAVVLSMLRLTPGADLPGYRRSVEGRVAAMARTQTLLARSRLAGADLRTVVEGELAPFLGKEEGAGPQAVLEGSVLRVPGGAAQPLAMAVHELTTNAVKYGALSVKSGLVRVSWGLHTEPDGVARLRLRWAEEGGPALAGTPERRGFGSRMLEGTVRGQMGGTVSLVWKASGLVCELEVPLRPASPQVEATP